MSEHYLEIADRLKLLVTGGSDCHGYEQRKASDRDDKTAVISMWNG
jgi:hypothetical protein